MSPIAYRRQNKAKLSGSQDNLRQSGKLACDPVEQVKTKHYIQFVAAG